MAGQWNCLFAMPKRGLLMNNLPEQMANKFTRRDQLLKLIEELGECTAAASRILQKLGNNRNDHNFQNLQNNFVDEIIDVEFLFAQMRYYFDGFIDAEERNNAEVKARFFND